MREFEPVPQPSGSLEPPRRFPPTAVGVETPEPEPQPRAARGFAQRPLRHLETALRMTIGLGLAVAGAALRTLSGRPRSGARR